LKALDVGTGFLVKAETDELTGEVVFTSERNAFLQAATSEDTEVTLKENNWNYVKHGNDYYILGEDALKLKNLLTIHTGKELDNLVVTKVGELRRPMQHGLLNTSEEKLSIAIIQKLIQNLIGPPKFKNEVLCFCSPSDPVDSDMSVIFHQTMITTFLKGLGYNVECIPEALAIIYSERPTTIDEDGKESPFSGVAISCGAGLINVCFAFRKMPLIAFSILRSGDYIDREAAKVTGLNISAVTRYKESKLDLNKIDSGNLTEAALEIFYQNMIEHALEIFADKFSKLDSKIESPLEIVVAGGTATVPGFIDKFKIILESKSLPFKVKGVRLAQDPLYTVANGCLIKAISVENKIKEEIKK